MEKRPKKSNGSFFKRFLTGLLGGLIGGALVFSAYYFLAGGSLALSNNGSSTALKNNSGTTKTADVTANVTTDVTSAVQKVDGAVVSVINLQKQKSSSGSDDLFGGLFGGSESSSSEKSNNDLTAASEGSGVIYKKDGNTAYIVTNNHVVDGSDGLEVLLEDGTRVKGELVGSDSYSDLAVIKISSANVKAVAEFGNSDKIKVGEPAIAIGSPLGSEYANSVTEGIVSSVNRRIESTNESGETVSLNAIQTDAAINPGNSGGPLLNIAGQVIGINSIKLTQTTGSSSGVSVEGMGFAIPSNDVVNIINQLETNGKVSRPALGIYMLNLSDVSSEQRSSVLGVPDNLTNGVVVSEVQSGTPAETAGLKQGDVITKLGDDSTDTTSDLTSALYKHKVGDTVEVTFYRGKDKKTVSLKLSLDASSLKQSKTKQDQTSTNE